MQAATKEALGKFNATPSIDFDAEERPQIPAFSMNDPLVSPPIPEYNPKYTPFEKDLATGNTESFGEKRLGGIV